MPGKWRKALLPDFSLRPHLPLLRPLSFSPDYRKAPRFLSSRSSGRSALCAGTLFCSCLSATDSLPILRPCSKDAHFEDFFIHFIWGSGNGSRRLSAGLLSPPPLPLSFVPPLS